MAIGGDHGMDVGIDLSIMIVVGLFMQGFHFGTTEYPEIGERIIETIFGEDIHGTTILYTIMIFGETGGLGIIPTIGISQSIENLHIIMMEDCMAVGKQKPEQLLREKLEQLEGLKLPHKEALGRVRQLDKESLEQGGILLQVLKYILQRKLLRAQVRPLRVNILKKQKKRNEV
jgi:hypothetical protein